MKKRIAKIIWLTGLSGSGKTTISNYLFKVLKKKKFKILRVDGDIFRKKFAYNNKFTIKNIAKNNLRIIHYVKKKISKYDFIIVSVISPLKKTRNFAKNIFKINYFEVNVHCSFKTLIKRDTKGLYKKALQNKIDNLIGFRSKIKYQKSNYRVVKINTDKLSIYKSGLKIFNIINYENNKIRL